MKAKITFLLTVILIGSQTVNAQWVEQQPGIGVTFEKIDCVDPMTCYLSGMQGAIMKTTDGGMNWIDISGSEIPMAADIFQMQAFSADTCYMWANGSNGSNFYKTYNSGANWTEVPLLIGLQRMYFINTSIGYSSSGGDLYKTTDRGDTWNLVKVDGGGTALFFISENIGFVARNTFGTTDLVQIFKTTDGGNNFTMVHQFSSTTGNIYDLQMVTDQIGYACSNDGKILKTIDGGDIWTELNHPLQGTGLFRSVEFINPMNGYIGGSFNVILKTTDGGQTWTDETYPNFNMVIIDISIANLDTVFAIAGGVLNLILKNSDANLTAKIVENELEIGQLFPNPVQNVLNVQIEKQGTTITLFDLSGTKIIEQELFATQNNVIHLNGLSNGVYLYEISDNSNFFYTGKIVKN